MTPVGHFMCASAVSGCTDVTSEKETAYCFAFYLLFLIIFSIAATVFPAGKWAMHLHDWAGNVALIYFFFAWRKCGGGRAAFVLILIGGQVLSAYTHAFDSLLLWQTGAIPDGFYRPHNMLHTPLAAFLVPFIALLPAKLLVKNVSWKLAYVSMLLGYTMHVAADSITYDYPIYFFWPINAFSASLASFFKGPDSVSAWLGNPLYVFEGKSAANTDGYIVYRAELLINVLLALLFAAKCLFRRLLKEQKDGS